MKLNTHDQTILERLGTEPCTVESLVSDLDISSEDLTARLRELADNGLVYDLGDGRFQRTESGRRVLMASDGEVDNRIDTSPEVERTLAQFDLDPEEADAVRGAFAFLRYWGHVTVDEFIDAIYSEDPAGFDVADAWWSELIRDPLSALPGVIPPQNEDEPWRYEGPAEVTTPLSSGYLPPSWRGRSSYGSVKHAIESLDISPEEREAVRAAFAYLRRHGEVADRLITEQIYHHRPAGYPSPQAWWTECVGPAFEQLPAVSYTEGVWRYGQPKQRPPSQKTHNEVDE